MTPTASVLEVPAGQSKARVMLCSKHAMVVRFDRDNVGTIC